MFLLDNFRELQNFFTSGADTNRVFQTQGFGEIVQMGQGRVASVGRGAEGSTGVYLDILDAAGNPVGARTLISQDSFSAALALRPDGGLTAYWMDTTGYTTSDVMIRQFDANGVPEGDAVTLMNLTDFGDYGERLQQVRMGPDGSVTFATNYFDNTYGTSLSGYVTLQRFAPDGSQVFDHTISQPAGMTNGPQEMHVLPNGDTALIYARFVSVQGQVQGTLMTAIMAPDGSYSQAPLPVPAPAGQRLLLGQIDDDGNFVLFFTENSGDPDTLTAIHVENGAITRQVTLDLPDGLPGSDLHAAALSDGDYMLAWLDRVDAYHRQVQFQSYNQDGVALGGPVVVNDPVRVSVHVSLDLRLSPDDAGGADLYLVRARPLSRDDAADPAEIEHYATLRPADFRALTNGADRHDLAAAGDIFAGAGNDTVFGSNGDDRFIGGEGDDLLAGRGGNDSFLAGPGSDTINGGAGEDVLFVDGIDPATIRAEFTGGAYGEYTLTLGADRLTVIGVEDLVVTWNGARISSAVIFSNDTPQTLTGGPGDSNLRGGTADDSISGGLGRDTLVGHQGNDTLDGGSTVGDTDLRDDIFGEDGDDLIFGGWGNDVLYGGAGEDTIEAGFGADTLVGQGGNDTLSGGAWSDAIFGGDGDDFINGGFGFDRLNGGAGSDIFYHVGVPGHGSDWIQDYDYRQGDMLQFGTGVARLQDLRVTFGNTPGAGDADIAEAFVTDRTSGQVLWALVDGARNDDIYVVLLDNVWDILD